jgi:aminoglycoside phosphotransferase
MSADLRNMYTLLKPISAGLDVLVSEFDKHVRAHGEACVREVIATTSVDQLSGAFVHAMLGVHDKYSRLMSELFANDATFTSTMEKVCVGYLAQTHERRR